MEIDSQKLEILAELESGNNLFISGSAGTGKSFLLKLIKDKYYQEGLYVTASTGIAAVNIGGTTIHSWAGIGTGNWPTSEILKFIFSRRGSKARNNILSARMLAIDEVSMISMETFELLNVVMQQVRGNNEAFGGVQLLLFGDFHQLPPINRNGEQKFCFESKAWQEADIKTHILKNVYRQDDQKFIRILENLRKGILNSEDLAEIEKCKNKPMGEIKPVIISTHNKFVESLNQREIEKLNTTEKTFEFRVSGSDSHIEFLKKNCLALEKLTLKVGCQVMMLKNTYISEGITNGSCGIVVEFSRGGYPVVDFGAGRKVKVTYDSWLVEEFNPDSGKIEEKAKLEQIPLILAYAITVHKSQGMTLDAVKCDLASAFEEGQIYVALSRVKSLDGLYIESFNHRLIKTNQKVKNFYLELV